MFGEMTRRRILETNLREAIRLGEMNIVFQPIVELATQRIVSYEALLRWKHPKFGDVSPSEFIPIAEDTGLIEPIGEWVLRQTCAWIATAPDDVTASVNVSAIQVRNGLATKAMNAVASAGLSPARLTLEITESTLLADDSVSLAALRELRSLGVRIALDDFGTGFSSLTYLKRFPFDVIKIDRSFTASIDRDSVNAATVRAIVGLARDLGISVVAEGVETEQEAETLRTIGCTLGQGYLYSKPLPGSAFVKRAEQPAPAVVARMRPRIARTRNAVSRRKQSRTTA